MMTGGDSVVGGTCDRDNLNRALVVAWRRADPQSRHTYEGKFFRDNRGCLGSLCASYGEDFVLGAAYLHIPKALSGFDLGQSRMSVIGYWKQRLGWKLPGEYARESDLIPTPLDPSPRDREEIKEFKKQARWVRPDAPSLSGEVGASFDKWETILGGAPDRDCRILNKSTKRIRHDY